MRTDLRALAEEDGSGDPRGRVDLHVAVHDDARHELATERCGPDLPLKEVRIRARVLGDRPDVRPVPVGDVAEERLALGKQLWEEILAEIEDLADGVALQDARLHDVDARIDRVGEDLAPRRLLQELGDPAVLVRYHDPVLERVRHVDERERHRGLALLVEGDDLGEIDVGQRIAGDDEERAVEVVADLPHGSTGAEGCLLDGVAEPHPQPAAVAIAVLDDRGEVLQRHEGFVDAVTEQEVEDVAKAWLVHDLHHRLRPIDRERSQAAPLAAGHDDGLHRVEFRPASDAQADALQLGSKRARSRARPS